MKKGQVSPVVANMMERQMAPFKKVLVNKSNVVKVEPEHRECRACGRNIDHRPKSYKDCEGCTMNDTQRRYNFRIGTTRRTRSAVRVLGVIR